MRLFQISRAQWASLALQVPPAQAQRACYGAAPTLADICLVPQMYNARRFGVDVAPFPRLQAICRHLEALPAFEAARPEAQPDSEQALASG